MQPKVYRVEMAWETTATVRAALEVYSRALTVELMAEDRRTPKAGRTGTHTPRILELLELKQRAANARRLFAEIVEPTPNANALIRGTKPSGESGQG